MKIFNKALAQKCWNHFGCSRELARASFLFIQSLKQIIRFRNGIVCFADRQTDRL